MLDADTYLYDSQAYLRLSARNFQPNRPLVFSLYDVLGAHRTPGGPPEAAGAGLTSGISR